MLGLMQDWPLLCHRIIDHAATYHGERPVVSRSVEGPIHTTNYGEIRTRALQGRQAARPGRHQARRPGGDARVEHLAPPRGVVRHPRRRRRSTTRVNPRLFPEQIAWIINHAEDRVMITDLTLRAAAGEARRQAAVDRALHRADRRRAHAADLAQECRVLRGLDRRGRRRLRLADLRREHRRRHLLHVGHHRQSQGRALFPPLERAARPHGVAAGREGHLVARRGACRWCRCSMPTAGRSRSRRRSWAPRWCCPAPRWTAPSIYELLNDRQGHVHRRGADRVADAAAASGEDRRQAALSQARGDRRLGLPARDDQDLPGRLRRRGDPRLGHDRDEPARLAVHDEAGLRALDRRGAPRPPAEAGPSAVRRRDEDRRRRRHAAAAGRQDLRPPHGARARRRQVLLQGRGRPHPR